MRDFIIVIGDGYRQQEKTADGVLIRTTFLPEHSSAARVAMECAFASIALYERLFGPYPYREFDVVEVPLNGVAGVEYPGLILVGESFCTDPCDPFFEVIIAHEVAHQWWYAVVGSDVVEEPWLDEAFATYCSALFLEEVYGIATARTKLDEWRSSYLAAKQENPGLSVTGPLYSFSDPSIYRAFVYEGGAVFLDTVRRTIGDAAFFSALASYYHDLAFKIAHAEDLLTRLMGTGGCELSAVFSRFLGP